MFTDTVTKNLTFKYFVWGWIPQKNVWKFKFFWMFTILAKVSWRNLLMFREKKRRKNHNKLYDVVHQIKATSFSISKLITSYINIYINDLIHSKYYCQVYWNSYNNVDSKNDQIFGLKILHFGIKIARHFLDVLKGYVRLIKIFWCSCSFKYTTYYWTKIKTICEQWHVQGKFTYSLHT